MASRDDVRKASLDLGSNGNSLSEIFNLKLKNDTIDQHTPVIVQEMTSPEMPVTSDGKFKSDQKSYVSLNNVKPTGDAEDSVGSITSPSVKSSP